MSFTVNNFVSALTGGADSGSASISIPSGHTVGVVVIERNFSGQVAGTLTDSAGNTYTIPAGGVALQSGAYVNLSGYSIAIASAITSVTYHTGTSGTNAFILYVWDITATGAISFADAKAAISASASGTDAVATGTLSITSSDGLILAGCRDWGFASNISSGTGFTTDSSVEAAAEHKAVTTSAAATFTDSSPGTDTGRAALAFQVASGGSVALTGQSTTSTAGSVVPSTSKALTGQAASFTPGTLAQAISKALTGQAATFAAGTIAPSKSVALTGQAATFAAGTVGAGGNVTTALTGQSATFTAGTAVATPTFALIGTAATSAVGSVTQSHAAAVSGQAATFASGLLAQSAAVLLAGQRATAANGTVSTGSDVTTSLTGQSSTLTAGSLIAASQIAVTGKSAAFAAGTLSFSASLALVGQSSIYTPGTLVQSRSGALTGQLALFASGVMLVPGGSVTASLTGQACALMAGSIAPFVVSVPAPVQLRGCDYGMSHPERYPDFEQDPDSTVDYPFAWAPDLEGDTIVTSLFLLPDGMTQVSASQTATTTVVFLSNAIPRRICRCTNRITTVGGRSMDKTIRILGRQQ